jgi:hypothetical protein
MIGTCSSIDNQGRWKRMMTPALFENKETLAEALRTGKETIGTCPCGEGCRVAVADHALAMQLITVDSLGLARLGSTDKGDISWFMSPLHPAIVASHIEKAFDH